MPRVALVVDDDAISRLVLCHMLRTRDWIVDEAADAPAAIERITAARYDLVISDFHLPSGTGVDILDAVGASEHSPAFVLITGIIEYSTLSPEITSRLAAQLTKPVSSETLRNALDELFPSTSE
jgi:CheY-like chemotaxis protein